MIKIQSGVTRIVILLKRFVIKIPNFRYGHKQFLEGCCANWSERLYFRTLSKCEDPETKQLHHMMAPSLFCSWFGLLQIQERCEPLNRDLTVDECLMYKPLCGEDNKKENFGVYQGRIVCLDYP